MCNRSNSSNIGPRSLILLDFFVTRNVTPALLLNQNGSLSSSSLNLISMNLDEPFPSLFTTEY